MLGSSENQDDGLHVLVTVSVGSVLSILPLHLSSWVAYMPGMRDMSSQGGHLKSLSPTNLQQGTAGSGSADGKTGLIAWSTGSPSWTCRWLTVETWTAHFPVLSISFPQRGNSSVLVFCEPAPFRGQLFLLQLPYCSPRPGRGHRNRWLSKLSCFKPSESA